MIGNGENTAICTVFISSSIDMYVDDARTYALYYKYVRVKKNISQDISGTNNMSKLHGLACL